MKKPHPSFSPEFNTDIEPKPGIEMEEAKSEAGVSPELTYLERAFVHASRDQDQELLANIIPRLKIEYEKQITNLKTKLSSAKGSQDKETILEELKQLEDRRLDFLIALNEPGAERKKEELASNLPYLYFGEPGHLLDGSREIELFRLKPEAKAYTIEDTRDFRFNIQGIELDKDFLQAEQELAKAKTKQLKEEALSLFNQSYESMFKKLEEFFIFYEKLGFGKRNPYVVQAIINSMFQLFKRRQNLIKNSLSALEWPQKSLSAKEIGDVAENNFVTRLYNTSYQKMFSIKRFVPPEGIFADEHSLRTWLTAVKLRCRHNWSFSEDRPPDANVTNSTDDFPEFEEKILALIEE